MSVLFEPLQIKHLRLRNRVVMPPMVAVALPELASLGDPEGKVSPGLLDHYAQRARGGTGLIIVEATATEVGGRCWATGLGAWSDEQIPGLRALAEALHAEGAAAAVQLVHGGPQADPALCPEGLVGPSEVSASEDRPAVRSLSREQIKAIEENFLQAARRLVEAGFDGVELHGAHGFLLDSFLSVQRNRRSDEYGGGIEGRMRALVETVYRLRAELPSAVLVWPRISLFNHLDEGFSAEDLRELAQGLEAAGADLLHLSTDGALRSCFDKGESAGQCLRRLTDLPVIVAGGLGDPQDAERAVAEGHADLAAVGTALLRDPEWTAHARQQLAG